MKQEAGSPSSSPGSAPGSQSWYPPGVSPPSSDLIEPGSHSVPPPQILKGNPVLLPLESQRTELGILRNVVKSAGRSGKAASLLS